MGHANGLGLDCPISVITDDHVVHQVTGRGITRPAVMPETTQRMLKSRSKAIKLVLTADAVNLNIYQTASYENVCGHY